MILDGQHRVASPVSPIQGERELRFVPMTAGSDWVGVHLALARGENEEPWSPVLLRSFCGGRILLGALVDYEGAVREWLDVWLQTLPGSLLGLAGNSDLRSNASLDARWDRLVKALMHTDPAAVLATGFEHRAPPPLWLNADESAPWPASQRDANDIELCTDEIALAAVGLASYGNSAERYLWRRGNPTAGFWKVSTEDFSASEMPSWAEPTRSLIQINPQAGRIFMRRHAPFDLETYADFLSGRGIGDSSKTTSFAFHDRGNGKPGDVCDQLQQCGAFLIPTTRGMAGRFLETFHLKLVLFAQAVKIVKANTEALRMPMLNLNASSIRVDFAAPAGDLPILWTARTALADISAAIAIPLPTTSARRFQRIGEPTSLIYSAPKGAPLVRGVGTLRIRKMSKSADRFTLQATLATDEYISAKDSELICIELPIPDGAPIPVYGYLDTAEALHVHERRFHSFPFGCSPEACTPLNRMDGEMFRQVTFGTVPHQGAGHDLYSLGVIGTRILLTHSHHTLAESIDELLSLARAMGRADGSTTSASALQLALSDTRWHAALGPQHHGHGCATPDEGYRWIPMELWWDAVAALTRFFPGAGAYSHAADLNDTASHPLEKTYEEPLRDLERLIQHSRSLLFSDWLANREVARVIQCIR